MTDIVLQRSADWLSGAGLRPTRQRMTLASLLVGDGQDRHVTAESLFDAAKDADEKVSLATVYNTLRAFCDVGLMREITDTPAPGHEAWCVSQRARCSQVWRQVARWCWRCFVQRLAENHRCREHHGEVRLCR